MQTPKVKTVDKVFSYLLFFAVVIPAALFFFYQPFISLVTVCLMWLLSAAYSQTINVTEEHIFATALVFPFVSKLFTTKIALSDIQDVSMRTNWINIRKVWDRLVLRDSLGRVVWFTPTHYEKEDIVTFLQNIKTRNPNVIFDESITKAGLSV